MKEMADFFTRISRVKSFFRFINVDVSDFQLGGLDQPLKDRQCFSPSLHKHFAFFVDLRSESCLLHH